MAGVQQHAAIGFAGIVYQHPDPGYFCRVRVIDRHQGRGLQLRLMRAMKSQARRNGWSAVVSDTTNNLPSANNFIRAGYRLYQPEVPWALAPYALWRRKWLG